MACLLKRGLEEEVLHTSTSTLHTILDDEGDGKGLLSVIDR
jgi:hypothetical protein